MRLEEAKRLLERLELPSGDYALHGSGPLLAHGLVEEVNDLDLIARGAAWARARELAPVSTGGWDDVVRPFPGVEIFNGWMGDDAGSLIDTAGVVGGLPCVSLDTVLAFKRKMNRPKDRAHIRLIEEFLARR